MRKVLVVTHPEASHHVDHLVGGWYDSQLTDRGQSQAAAIAAEIRSRIPHDAEVELFSSDLARTAQTADVIGAALGVATVLSRGLREKSYGEAEGRPQAWLDERFAPPPAAGDRMNHFEGIGGSETKAEWADRVYEAAKPILERQAEWTVIVTHGGTFTLVLACWIRMPVDTVGYVHFRASAGGITELSEDNFFHSRQVVQLNYTEHLDGI